MIAKNYIRFPEALRFQVEMFSNGYHNSPRIMRLVECIFSWAPSAPAWWTETKGRAQRLAKSVRKAICDMFAAVPSSPPDDSADELPGCLQSVLDDLFEIAPRWTPQLRACTDDQACMADKDDMARMGGYYKRYCRAGVGYQGQPRRAGNVKAYHGGFSE